LGGIIVQWQILGSSCQKKKVEGNPLGNSIVGFFAMAIVNQHPTSAPVGHSLPWMGCILFITCWVFRADPLP
jgi:hypothetical protein